MEGQADIYGAGREMGALTEAVRTLQGRFDAFEVHVSKRCSDCSLGESLKSIRRDMGDHEARLRWVERKLYGAVAVTGFIVWALGRMKL